MFSAALAAHTSVPPWQPTQVLRLARHMMASGAWCLKQGKRPAPGGPICLVPSDEGLCREPAPPDENTEAKQADAEEQQAGRFGDFKSGVFF